MSLTHYAGCCLISRYKGQKCPQGQGQPPLSQGKFQLSVSHTNALSILAGTDLPEPHILDHLQHHTEGRLRHKSFYTYGLVTCRLCCVLEVGFYFNFLPNQSIVGTFLVCAIASPILSVHDMWHQVSLGTNPHCVTVARVAISSDTSGNQEWHLLPAGDGR